MEDATQAMGSHSFDENLQAERAHLEAAFENIEPGPQRDLLERKLRQIETASHINGWLSSSVPQPPK
jgi:hypothetical protein